MGRALRRGSELAALEYGHINQRDGRRVFVNLVDKGLGGGWWDGPDLPKD